MTHHDLLSDLRTGPTITVRLEAAMSTEGGITGLRVLIHDPVSGEDLDWPIPPPASSFSPHELELAAALWCMILDGNADRLE